MPTSTPYIDEDFMLESEPARRLYHVYAKPLPIIDYHCHLSPQLLAENRKFRNITEAWLEGDHYKWRAMRTAGVPEHFITGGANDWEKFSRWAETVPKTLRNPLYHWSHLELNRNFGIQGRLIDADSAPDIWQACNTLLATDDFSTQGILRRMNVEVVCTTDDPTDDLQFHDAMRQSSSLGLYPTFRADNAICVDAPAAFVAYVHTLEAVTHMEIRRFQDFQEALDKRHRYFHEHGCRISDVGLDRFPHGHATDAEAERDFAVALSGQLLAPEAASALRGRMLNELGVLNNRRGWVQQFHIGAMRNTNSRMDRLIGPNTGYDSIGDGEVARPLAQFLDRLAVENQLSKTIIYNLNPRDNELLAAMIGNFQDGSVAGKIQYGAAWWFLDQRDGITRQLEALSNLSLLSQFVGMLTDSRSFLSYPRHEYFRRVLCNLLGDEMRRGLIPNDFDMVGNLVQDVCYRNARRYFDLAPPMRDTTNSLPT
jgi:glucuronate isomerase